MDVRASLNAQENTSIIAKEGEKSFVDNDSFYAEVPPLAASTVGRSKARRLIEAGPEAFGSFLAEETAGNCPPLPLTATNLRTASVDTEDWKFTGFQSQNTESSDNATDRRSSLGILDIDELDYKFPSPTPSPRQNSVDRVPANNTTGSSTLTGGSVRGDSNRYLSSDSDTLHNDKFPHESDSKPDQPFASSHSSLGTVVKKAATRAPEARSALPLGLRQSLFGAAIGEEGEGDTTLPEINLEDEELHALDKDFEEMECSSVADDDSDEDTQKTPTAQSDTSMIRVDSLYLRPGVTGSGDAGNQSSLKLSCLSKVSLFDENEFHSDTSEIDTEDELEMARRAQRARQEAAGEASASRPSSTRPGLEGGCSDDNRPEVNGQLPIAQRQSAEGDVVSSPVPGDGGGGGDGSSGSDSESGRHSNLHVRDQARVEHFQRSIPTSVSMSQSRDRQEQRIRPMGDDLLSEMQFSRYAAPAEENEDTRLQSRYLQPTSPTDDASATDFNIEDYFGQTNATDQDFDPGDRLEASGFNADDFSGAGSNPFGGVMVSSFGSFGAEPPPGQEAAEDLSGEGQWQEMNGSVRTSAGSKHSSTGSHSGSSSRAVARSSDSLEIKFARHDGDDGIHPRYDGLGVSSSRDSGMQSRERSRSPEGMKSVQSSTGSKSDTQDTDILKKPAPPPPRAGMKLKASLSAKNLQSQLAAAVRKSESVKSSDEEIDLAFRTSLTDQARVQQEGFKHAPSHGGTRLLDMTLHDDEFFNNDDAMAMLNADEVEFQEDNVLRKDDAMVDMDRSTPDSWAYQSVMSIARPSWMEDPSEEEKVLVRISVGSYMRGRTEALGTLTGDEAVDRPEFGRPITSPKRDTRLRDVKEDTFEEARTSGVGEYGETGQKSHAENTLTFDSTMTLSLLGTPVPKPTRTSQPEPKPKTAQGGFSEADISMFFKSDDIRGLDPKQMTQRLLQLGLSKAGPKVNQAKQLPEQLPVSAAQPTTSVKSPRSKLPLKQGSNISRTFPKVPDGGSSLVKSHSKTSTVEEQSRNESGGAKCDMSCPPLNLDVEFERMQETHKKLIDEFERKSGGKEIVSAPNTNSLRKSTGVDDDSKHSTSTDESKSNQKWLSPNRSTSKSSITNHPSDLNLMFSNNALQVSQANLDSDIQRTDDHVFKRPESAVRPKKFFKAAKANAGKNLALSSAIIQSGAEDERETPPADGQATPEECLPQSIVPLSTSSRNGSVDRLNVEPQTSRYSSPRKENVVNSGLPVNRSENRTETADLALYAKPPQTKEPDLGPKYSASERDRGRMDSVPKSIPTSMDRGVMPGHHIPDGTEYSQRSDYAHMDHKGMSRDDLVGIADIGLAESRGFDAIKGTKKQLYARSGEAQDVPMRRAETERFVECNRPGGGQISQSSMTVPSSNPRGSGSSSAQTCSSLPGPTYTSCTSPSRPLRSTETQTNGRRQEISTQTSLVFRESVGVQPDTTAAAYPSQLIQNSSVYSGGHGTSHSKTSSTPAVTTPTESRMHQRQVVNESRTVQRPVSSFNHNLIPNRPRDPEKPHLLSEESLMNTDFAQDYFNRDLSMEVLEQIYSSEFQTMYPSHDRTGDDSHMFPPRLSTMTLTPSSMHTLSSTGYQPRQEETGHTVLCPVEAPGVLSFADVCCLGISKEEILALTNPTGRWLECQLQVHSLKVDGLKASLDNFPFQMKEKIIIEPFKTGKVSVIFIPKYEGVYVAEIKVISQPILGQQSTTSNSIPVCVSFHAIAEEPKIKVTCDGESRQSVDFGELMWGNCREKTLRIENQGHAMLPLRLAITANRSWHCFTFEPEGRVSDVSIVSGRPIPGHGNIMNLSLAGADDRFNFHEIRVWCRPPDKQIDNVIARLPPEDFSCHVAVELDVPCMRFPVLTSMQLRARVGVHKLHIQSGLKEMKLKGRPGKKTAAPLGIFNAGNLDLHLEFVFPDQKDVFSVTPTHLTLQPNTDTELKITCSPPADQTEQKYTGRLLMVVLPDGFVYEVMVVLEMMPKEAAAQAAPWFVCDHTKMDFGGLPVGKQHVKVYQLINKESSTLMMRAEINSEEFQFIKEANPPFTRMQSQELCLEPNRRVPVYVLFSPTATKSFSGKVVMKPYNCSNRYTVRLSGYGGVSDLVCESQCQTVEGRPSVFLERISGRHVKHLVFYNPGSRPASVSVTAYTDYDCKQRLASKKVLISPWDFSITDKGKATVDIVLGMSDRELASHLMDRAVVSVLKFSYQDTVDSSRPYSSSLVIGVLGSSLDIERRPHPDVFRTPVVSFKKTSSSLSPTVPQVSHFTAERPSTKEVPFLESRRAVEAPLAESRQSFSVVPDQMTLHCPARDSRETQFYIYNLQDKDMSFDITWPGHVLYVSPNTGVIRARQSQKILICPQDKVSREPQKLPWHGSVFISCEATIKTMKVQIQSDAAMAETVNQLIPVVASTIAPTVQSSMNKLGDLEVSRVTVQFPPTVVGRTTEELIVLKNSGEDMMRWMFLSFASPYLQRTADSGKEMFRVSYQVFDFSHQFGKLSGHSTTQLILKFMPWSTGSFSQYWDIQTTGHAGNPTHDKEYIRIHLTGEGVEEPQKESQQNFDAMAGAKPKRGKLELKCDSLTFAPTSVGASLTMKAELKNMYAEDIQVEVTAPNPPFYIKHPKIEVDKKRYLRYPVDFCPKRPGWYSGSVKFQGSKGDNLILKLEAECVDIRPTM